MCCSVNGFVCLVCCVFDSVCELFGETIRNMCGYGCYLVLNVLKCLVCVEVFCWIDSVWSSTECAWCACDPSLHLRVPSIVCFVYCCGLFFGGPHGCLVAEQCLLPTVIPHLDCSGFHFL